VNFTRVEHSLVNLDESGPEPSRARRAPAKWLRFVVGFLCVLVAFIIRYWLSPVLGGELPFLLFIAAALISAWYGGAVSGTLALLLGLLLADYFFVPPRHTLGESPIEIADVLRYLFTATLGVVLIEVLHRGKRRTETALRELEREIERRKRSEEALREARDQLGQLAVELEGRVAKRTSELADTVESLKDLLYQIAHNLRAPLRAIDGYTTLLMREYGQGLDDTAHHYSRHISEAARRMDRLIHDLLEYGQLGHRPLTLTEVDLGRAVEQVLYQLAHEIKGRNARVRVDQPLPRVQADLSLLEQMLLSLLENALKFVPAGVAPDILIRAETREAMVRLCIEDNGIGVDSKYHDRIFGAFERLHASNTYEGTGIGLAMVKQGMHRLGGRVGLESRLGEGSRFWLEFPSRVSRK
jgi:signal transduction histidine kinase